MTDRSSNFKKAKSTRIPNDELLRPSQGSASSQRSSRRGSDATFNESVGSFGDEDDEPEADSDDEEQEEVDLSSMTPAERLAHKRRMKRFR